MTYITNAHEQRMARIKNDVQIPMIIRENLSNKEILGPGTIYALHEILSNQTAEKSILCAVMTLQEIMNFHDLTNTDTSFLAMECDRLIERYVARDELADENKNLWNETQKEMMSVIAEDIENFLDLVNLCNMSFEVIDSKITKILDIIAIQLQSQLIIVDEIIELLDTQKRSASLNIQTPTGIQADNIIMFPV